MVFVIWLVLFGLGIDVHGLFSEQILEWTGVMLILLGIGALALPASHVATQWLAASAFGLGMPLLATMLDRGESKSAGPPQGSAIVAIPAGTTIPLKVCIHGNIVQDAGELTVPLALARPIDVVVVDGKPNGIFRVADGDWKRRNSLWISDFQPGATLAASSGPAASVSITFMVSR